MNLRARFYREVSVQPPSPQEDGYRILLDAKPVRTPAGALLRVPNAALAEAIAEEWRVQGDKIRPDAMTLTKQANTAIDQGGPNRQAAIAQILSFAKSDCVCYRAQDPQILVQRQSAQWDPLLAWVRARHGAHFRCGGGIGFIEQPQEALAVVETLVQALDDFALAGLHRAATLLGSTIIAMALWEGRLTGDLAFAAAELEAIYQAEGWGQDSEAQNQFRKKGMELADISRFLDLLRG